MDRTTFESMIDSHCHLDLNAFDADRHDVIKRAQQKGVSRIHIPGTTSRGWKVQQAMVNQYPELDYSLGFHPYFLSTTENIQLTTLENAYESAIIKPIAMGEMGLDAAIDVDFSLQEKVCLMQLELAKTLGLPVILHHRQTQHDLLKLIKRVRFEQGGILHAFSGSYEAAMQFIEAGFLLGIGGTITYERAKKTINTLKQIDIEHLVLETDSPDMPLHGRQGVRNEPACVTYVCASLARLKGVDSDAIATQTSNNYFRIFARSLKKPRSI